MSRKIRTIIIGIGNSASALIQGLEYYGDDDTRPGLWHRSIGDYSVSDIEIVGAYDIDVRKVGKDISDAMFSPPNMIKKYTDVRHLGIDVESGALNDQINPSLSNLIKHLEQPTGEIIDSIKEKDPDVVLNLISSGMDKSSDAYVSASLQSDASFINATTSPIASSESSASKFADKNLVVVGDDLMSQFGGTVFHKSILNLMLSRGVKVKKSYQLDVGGGAETQNTLDEDLRAMKGQIKSDAISVEIPYPMETAAGTTDYVDFLGNGRTSYFWIDGEQFLGSPVRFDIYLKTSDGPNAGGLLIDLIRATQTAKNNGDFGAVKDICNYGFKRTTPPSKLIDSYERFKSKYIP